MRKAHGTIEDAEKALGLDLDMYLGYTEAPTSLLSPEEATSTMSRKAQLGGYALQYLRNLSCKGLSKQLIRKVTEADQIKDVPDVIQFCFHELGLKEKTALLDKLYLDIAKATGIQIKNFSVLDYLKVLSSFLSRGGF